MVLFYIGVVLSLMFGISRVLSAGALRNTGIDHSVSRRALMIGDMVEYRVELENRKLLPMPWINVEVECPKDALFLKGRLVPHYLPVRKLLVFTTSLRWFEKVSRVYRFSLNNRGIYRIGPVKYVSGDIFGLYSKSQTYDDIIELTVYPRFVPVYHGMDGRRHLLGSSRARSWVYEDADWVKGIREYSSGDPVKRIDWKATSRTGELKVRIWEPKLSMDVCMIVNINTYRYYWEGIDSNLLEYTIMVMASLCRDLLSKGHRLDLYVNTRAGDDAPVTELRKLSGHHCFKRVLQAAAHLQPVGFTPLEKLLLRGGKRTPQKAEYIVITPVMTPEIESALKTMGKAGNRIILVLIGNTNSGRTVDGIPTLHALGEEKWNEIKSIELV